MGSVFEFDTICAIATPVGEGGIGIIRISGPDARPIALKLFRSSRPADSLPSHRFTYGWISDPASQSVVDEVLLVYMAAPRTYTREDVVEIHCHSGYAVLERLLELVLAAGARLAEPGEFTKRAFLNGRLDLSQAEAVIEVIRARSPQGLLLAHQHLQGNLRDAVQEIRQAILRVHAQVEAAMDFSDELDDEPPGGEALIHTLDHDALAPLQRLIHHAREGRILREGLRIVLVGKPNVGKSSLLNALLAKDRAIVTPFPGTTRDVIEERFILSGVSVRLLDTAGLRHAPDAIESMGIERTLRAVEEADALLWLIDRSRSLDTEDDRVHQAVRGRPYIILLNKSDLTAQISAEDVCGCYSDGAPILEVSALHPPHIERIKSLLTERFLRQPLETSRSALVPNLRQRGCLEQAQAALGRARALLLSSAFGELTSIELRSARDHLDAILGLRCEDALLDHIFSEFCVGK